MTNHIYSLLDYPNWKHNLQYDGFNNDTNNETYPYTSDEYYTTEMMSENNTDNST